jgi:hypothetical protein
LREEQQQLTATIKDLQVCLNKADQLLTQENAPLIAPLIRLSGRRLRSEHLRAVLQLQACAHASALSHDTECGLADSCTCVRVPFFVQFPPVRVFFVCAGPVVGPQPGAAGGA